MFYFKQIDEEDLQQIACLQFDGEADIMSAVMEWTFDNESFARVIVEDDIPVGFMVYYLLLEETDNVKISFFEIDKRFKAEGYEALVFKEAEAYLKKEYPAIKEIKKM